MNNQTCSDVDECSLGDDNCDPVAGICFNIDGGYFCLCQNRYMLLPDFHICLSDNTCPDGAFCTSIDVPVPFADASANTSFIPQQKAYLMSISGLRSDQIDIQLLPITDVTKTRMKLILRSASNLGPQSTTAHLMEFELMAAGVVDAPRGWLRIKNNYQYSGGSSNYDPNSDPNSLQNSGFATPTENSGNLLWLLWLLLLIPCCICCYFWLLASRRKQEEERVQPVVIPVTNQKVTRNDDIEMTPAKSQQMGSQVPSPSNPQQGEDQTSPGLRIRFFNNNEKNRNNNEQVIELEPAYTDYEASAEGVADPNDTAPPLEFDRTRSDSKVEEF